MMKISQEIRSLIGADIRNGNAPGIGEQVLGVFCRLGPYRYRDRLRPYDMMMSVLRDRPQLLARLTNDQRQAVQIMTLARAIIKASYRDPVDHILDGKLLAATWEAIPHREKLFPENIGTVVMRLSEIAVPEAAICISPPQEMAQALTLNGKFNEWLMEAKS